MPKSFVQREIELSTRNAYTKLKTKVSIELDGVELPTLAVLGAAFDNAIELIQKEITESYKVIPERV